MIDDNYLQEAITTLKAGGTILFPTDTIWGLGCDATNEEAVKKIYKIKNRPQDKPLILLASSIEMIKTYVKSIHPKIETLLLYHSRPLTVIYENARNLPSILLPKDKSIGIRIPQDEFCRKLIESYGKPLVSTSANISSQPYPNSFGEIQSNILKNVDHIVALRQQEKSNSKPSVIIKLDQKGELLFLRD